MASAAADIRAGRSYVELYIKKSLVGEGLKAIQTELKAFGDRVASIGKKLSLFGGLITGPMLLAAKSWASSGEELYRLSQRTGMAVESLSMLKFAAEETGTEFEAVETGIKRMQRAIIASQRGSGHLPWLRELVNLKPEEQLERVADRIARFPTRHSGPQWRWNCSAAAARPCSRCSPAAPRALPSGARKPKRWAASRRRSRQSKRPC